MKKNFWQERWQSHRTGFHQEAVNEALVKFAPSTFRSKGRILVPLCGKSVDLDWLVNEGYRVVGVEFVPAAVSELVDRLGPPTTEVQSCSFVQRDWGEQLTILQGDIFDLPSLGLGPFDGVWDRAAVVALKPETRPRYAEILRASIGEEGVILMRTFAYDQDKMEGPPFSVDQECVVRQLFPSLKVEVLESLRKEPDAKFQERGMLWQSIETYAIQS